MIDELAPARDEIVLPKTSSSVFNSTNLDYLLRNIGIEDVFVTGFLTDQCIDHAVKDGADLGYYMTCVHDACAAETEARHEAALSCFKGYCRMLSTAETCSTSFPATDHWPLFSTLISNGLRSSFVLRKSVTCVRSDHRRRGPEIRWCRSSRS